MALLSAITTVIGFSFAGAELPAAVRYGPKAFPTCYRESAVHPPNCARPSGKGCLEVIAPD